MKHTLLLLLLLSGICSNAQFSYGAKGGLSVSNTKIADVTFVEPENKYSFYVGVVGEYKFTKTAVELGLSYNDLGNFREAEVFVNGDPNEPRQTREFSNNFTQLTLTPALKYYFIDSFSIKAGGYVGFILSNDDKHGEEMAYLEYSSIDYGLTIGAEYTFYKSLFAEVSYNYGLNDIVDYDTSKFDPEFDPIIDGGAEHPNYKSRFLLIGLGYRF